eukprot:10381477-Alexandrium_andersonii.AAC.1
MLEVSPALVLPRPRSPARKLPRPGPLLQPSVELRLTPCRMCHVLFEELAPARGNSQLLLSGCGTCVGV